MAITALAGKKLFVVFHGLCAFFQRRQAGKMEILLPDLREARGDSATGTPQTYSPHVYRAGSWLAETEIWPGADLALEGVTPGRASFGDRHIMLKGPVKRSAKAAYARLVMPLPARIHALRQVTARPGVELTGASVSEVRGDKLATIPVFEYEVPDESQLRLGNHPWVPAAAGDSITLHVFAEPEVPQGVAHSHTEFTKVFELFEGADLQFAHALRLPKITDTLPPGLQIEELEDLIPRTRRMAILGRFQKSQQDPSLVWDKTEPFGELITACTGGGGDEDGGDDDGGED